MIKFLKVLFSKLVKKKDNKSITKHITRKINAGNLPKGIEITELGDGTYKIVSDTELTMKDIINTIENYLKDGGENA